MALSPRQPSDRQRVLRITGSQIDTTLTTEIFVKTHLKKSKFRMETIDRKRKGRGDWTLWGKETKLFSTTTGSYSYSGEDDGKHGVGFVFSPGVNERVVLEDQVNNKISAIYLNTDPISFGIVQAYVPQQGRAARENNSLYERLQETIYLANYGSLLIICGDLNVPIGTLRKNYEKIMGPYSAGDENWDGARILNFAAINNLSVMNSYYQHRLTHKWTWYGYDGPLSY